MPRGRKVSLRRRRRQRGGEIVEGATTFLVFFVMVFGLIDFSRMVWTYHQLAFGAREATRYAIVHGSSSGNKATVSQIQAIVTNRVFCVSSNNLTTTVTFNPNQGPGSTVKVAVTYSFYPIAPFLPGGAIQLASTSQMMIYQ
jgi:Flp pilus assembly protein TadG